MLIILSSVILSRQPAPTPPAEERVEYYGTPPPPPLFSLGSTKSPNYYHTPPPSPIFHENPDFAKGFGGVQEQVQYYKTPPPPFSSYEQNRGSVAGDFQQLPSLSSSQGTPFNGGDPAHWEREQQDIAPFNSLREPNQPAWDKLPPHRNVDFMPANNEVVWPPKENLYQQPAQKQTQAYPFKNSVQPRELEYYNYGKQEQSPVEAEVDAEEEKVTPKPFIPSVRAFAPYSQRIDPESAVPPKSIAKPQKRKRPVADTSKRRPRTHAVISKGDTEPRQVPQLFAKLAKPRSSTVQIVPTTEDHSPISKLMAFLRQKYLDLVKPGSPRTASRKGLQEDIVFALSAISSLAIGTVLALPQP